MKFKARVKKPTNKKLADGKNGSLDVQIVFHKSYADELNNKLDMIQRAVDSECLKRCDPYVPYQTGMLQKSAVLHTVIGSGDIVYATPYARYLYYGIKYSPSYPITKGGELVGFYSPPKKYPTNEPLKYNKSFHKDAGAFWFERMKAEHLTDILEVAQRIANSEGDSNT